MQLETDMLIMCILFWWVLFVGLFYFKQVTFGMFVEETSSQAERPDQFKKSTIQILA